MRIERQRSVAAQIVIGVFVILLGLGFLLDNMGLVDFLPSVHLLPLLLVVFGLIKVVQTRTTQGMLVGALMMVFGGLLTLKGMGLIYLSWRAIWPVMMIVLGCFVVFRSVTRGQNGGRKAEAFVFTPLEHGAGCGGRQHDQRQCRDGRLCAARYHARFSRRRSQCDPWRAANWTCASLPSRARRC